MRAVGRRRAGEIYGGKSRGTTSSTWQRTDRGGVCKGWLKFCKQEMWGRRSWANIRTGDKCPGGFCL